MSNNVDTFRYIFLYILLSSLISTNKQVKSNNVINRFGTGKVDCEAAVRRGFALDVYTWIGSKEGAQKREKKLDGEMRMHLGCVAAIK